MPHHLPCRLLLLLSSLVCACLAQENILEPDDKEKPSPWEFSASAGLSLTSGNSETLALNTRFLGTYRDLERDAYFGADYFYSEDFGETNNNSFRLFGAYNHLISEKFYLGFHTNLLTNEASLLDYRVDFGPTLGYYFQRNHKSLLSVEVGLGYAFESEDSETDSFATFRLAQHFDYRWSQITRIRQFASLTPKAEDASNYIFEFSAGLDLRINDRWDIQPRITHRIDLSPALGSDQADTLLTVGLAYSLNGFLKEEIDRADERKTLREKTLKTEGNRKGWVRNAGFTGSSTSGNSSTINLNLNYESIFRSDHRDFLFRGNYRFSESNSSTSQNRLNLLTSHSWKFGKSLYSGISTQFAYDASTDLNYRNTSGVHIGFHPILTDYGGLALEAGLGYTFQEEGETITNATSFNLAQRLYWQLSYHTYITQEISYQAFLENPSDFNLSSFIFLDTFLTDNLSWRIGLEYFYDGNPAPGRRESDFSLLSGISVSF